MTKQAPDHANCAVGEELLERVELAIRRALHDEAPDAFAFYTVIARAALAAMPTPAAIRAETT